MKIEEEKSIEKLKTFAASVCIDIYHDYEESELQSLIPHMQRAWKIGRRITKAITSKSDNER